MPGCDKHLGGCFPLVLFYLIKDVFFFLWGFEVNILGFLKSSLQQVIFAISTLLKAPTL
jgi:hypothetical protein